MQFYDLNNNKEQTQKYRNEFIKLYFNTDDIDTEFVLLDMLRRNVDKYNFKVDNICTLESKITSIGRTISKDYGFRNN